MSETMKDAGYRQREELAFQEAEAAGRSYADLLAKTYGAAMIGWLALLGTVIETITEREAVGWIIVLLLLFAGITLSLRNLHLVKKRTQLIFVAYRDGEMLDPGKANGVTLAAGRLRNTAERSARGATWLLAVISLIVVVSLAYSLFIGQMEGGKGDDVSFQKTLAI